MVEAAGDTVSWVDIANLAVSAGGLVLTVLLVLGAFLAYTQTKKQIRQTEQHHSEQLKASLRPLIVVPHAECLVVQAGTGPHAELQAWVQNVGPGPAMQIEIVAWVVVPSVARSSSPERRREIDDLKASVDISEPQLTARVGALASGDKARPAPLIPNAPLPAVDYAAQQAVLLYLAKYQNLFEDRFPSKPEHEWQVGHIDLTPAGSWSR